jgi:arsenite/tail-anchored protein-transporting ATPase
VLLNTLDELLAQQVVFFGGKGGVGKTTCSAAFAVAASRRGRNVLLVSTDPAHSTADIFEQRIGSSERQILPRLTAVEIDAEQEARRYIGDVKRDIERMFSPSVIRQAHRQIDLAAASPGLAEVALLDRMIDLIVGRAGDYDLVVFDTAPTGHTLQLLRMPEAITTWIQALVRHRRALVEIDRGSEQTAEAAARADPVLDALERRQERVGRLRGIITDRRRTSFVLVMLPERLVIDETARAAELLGDAGIDLGGLVVKRVLPDDLEGEFYRSRKAQERTYLDEIERRFKRFPRVIVRQLARDVYGTEPLTLISEQLMAKGVGTRGAEELRS